MNDQREHAKGRDLDTPDSVAKHRISQVRRFSGAVAAIWTLLFIVLMVWNVAREQDEARDAAIIQARMAFEKDILYRRWAAGHGGVYVPVSASTPPNPYLSELPQRDITTPSGRQLTLMNPAYMTRQVYELEKQVSGIRGHITSLKPIRPENAPEHWERQALQGFERGDKEISSVEDLDGIAYLRFMRPFFIEKTCLKCHGRQGYREGDIRGGLSVSIPLEPFLAFARTHIRHVAEILGAFWLAGLGGIGLGAKQLIRTERKRTLAEEQRERALKELEQSNQELEQRLREIKTLQGMLPICSFCKKIRDDKGYWQKIETYVHAHSEAKFSHSMCPECEKKAYEDLENLKKRTLRDKTP